MQIPDKDVGLESGAAVASISCKPMGSATSRTKIAGRHTAIRVPDPGSEVGIRQAGDTTRQLQRPLPDSSRRPASARRPRLSLEAHFLCSPCSNLVGNLPDVFQGHSSECFTVHGLLFGAGFEREKPVVGVRGLEVLSVTRNVVDQKARHRLDRKDWPWEAAKRGSSVQCRNESQCGRLHVSIDAAQLPRCPYAWKRSQLEVLRQH